MAASEAEVDLSDACDSSSDSSAVDSLNSSHADESEGDPLAEALAEVEQELELIAEGRELVRRPQSRNQTTKRLRQFVPSPRDREEAREKRLLLAEVRLGVDASEEAIDFAAGLMEEILFAEWMHPDEGIRLRKTTVPCFCSVDETFERLHQNGYLFAQTFAGFTPNEVKILALELFRFRPHFTVEGTKYSVEECLLVVLARLKLTIGTFELMEFLFQRAASTLISIFRDVVQFLLDEFFDLLSVQSLVRFKEIGALCKRKMLEKYREKMNNPDAKLPHRFAGVGGFMDGSKFMICRPGLDSDADIQRAFYNNKGNAHYINVLSIVFPNGIRGCVQFGTGRHADPFMVTDELKAILAFIDVPILGDAIFGRSDYIRGVEKLTSAKISAAKSCAVSHIRMPVEWSFAEIKQHFPLVTTFTKLKLFSTRPRAIIEIATLFANLRVCLRGENATTYFGMLPPSLDDYLCYGVAPAVTS